MNRVLIIFFLIAVIFACLAMPVYQFSDTMAWIYISIGLICALLFFFAKDWNYNIKKTFLRPAYLFVISYLIVFFQRPADYILGYTSGYLKVGEVAYMLMSLNYAVVGLCCFIIGYLSMCGKTREIAPVRSNSFYTYKASPVIYSVLSSLLILMTLIFVPSTILFGGYNNDMLTNATIYNYIASWCNTILIAYIVQFTINAKQEKKLEGCSITKYIKSLGVWQNVNLIVYAIIILNVGDRGPLIYIALSLFFSYLIVSNRKPSRIRIVFALCLGVMILSILGETKYYLNNNTILDRLKVLSERQDNSKKVSFLPATEQLSGSYCCLPIALQMVPANKDYSYGAYTCSDLVAGVPFAGRIIGESSSSSYDISKFAMGDNFSYGLGTSCIASLYMDGGLILILLGMTLCGMAMRKFESSIFSRTMPSLFMFCMAFYFLTHVVYIPRSSLLSPFKYALWMYVIMCIFSYLQRKRKKA